MKVYRLKHIPTGLYFKGVGRDRCNLAPTGKLYSSKPSRTWTETIRIDYRSSGKLTKTDKVLFDWYKEEAKYGRVNKLIPTLETDWELIEIEG